MSRDKKADITIKTNGGKFDMPLNSEIYMQLNLEI